MKLISDEEIIGDCCKRCDFAKEDCIGHNQPCDVYKSRLKEGKRVANLQLQSDLASQPKPVRESSDTGEKRC